MDASPQQELVERLCAIFPAFRSEWQLDQEDATWPSESLHSVYQSFLPFVSGAKPSVQQLRCLAGLIDGEVARGGDAENAVATCLLEHLGQVGMLPALRPLLGSEARVRLYS
ncbi:hypothetical protein QLQ15_16500 [Lysobacter sp. LF1]|uniref:Uncharacterized protein n=1 Tax=Lysobacter stagni TaxID=3045172 RepID=A0ABT6XK02_9GAMM|nr:hypothetical protein [Lysobacter sp. LF1]MDI9240506.1 hypothetical protein [Lysobacter sp. LF1]